ncbi:farnesyl pyrophosphate synthase-like [Amaranthus tricolor]|uniref:farnesyl pyrophosphate synthase-like n=1 Tax=Amaranthus tricolor TaxID=29722 RepID=UPI00258CB0CF|nr:farnesyl pyrophosphate synthase-like [Amaranthus tricolor]
MDVEQEEKERFQQVYEVLKKDVLEDPAFEHDDVSLQWVQQMMDYNVPGGKQSRAMLVIESLKRLKDGKPVSEEEFFRASVMGWCIQWAMASALMQDDIVDNSNMRRGKPCWFRLPKVGLIALNDSTLLGCQAGRIAKKHFRDQPYYRDYVDLISEIGFQTISGQMIDLITEGEKDIWQFNMTLHQRISLYKTAYGTTYLPFACALLMLGEKVEDFVDAKDILLEMGIYFQVQDDYLDCFGDPEKMGKVGTDIEESKCSWLVVKALELCDEEQKKILVENYMKSDQESVAIVKCLYKDLNLEGVYAEYEANLYEKLIGRIEAIPNTNVRKLLKSYLDKIYLRQK